MILVLGIFDIYIEGLLTGRMPALWADGQAADCVRFGQQSCFPPDL